MSVYIAMLRGINVGAYKRIKMEKLSASCEALGFEQVKTYIQSGNIVFQGGKLKAEAISKKMEEQIFRDFGFSADLILRTREELERIIKANPLLRERAIDKTKLHVVFLSSRPAPEALKRLESIILAPDKVRPSGKEIYFYFPNGVSRSSLWKHNLDRELRVTGTMRNWNTVNQLYEMAAACG